MKHLSSHLRRGIIFLEILLACLFAAIPAMAMFVTKMAGGKRKNVSHFIAVGIDQLDIRVGAIRDWKLVAAILHGARTRHINVLADQDSPELRALVGHPNLRVRITTGEHRGKFGSKKLSQSFVLAIHKAWYQEWAGALVWTKRLFRPTTTLGMGSGNAPYEDWPMTALTFYHDFSAAVVLRPAMPPILALPTNRDIKLGHHQLKPDTLVNVATIQNDTKVADKVRDALKKANIPVLIVGSFGYGVYVPEKDRALALTILEKEAKKHIYRILINR